MTREDIKIYIDNEFCFLSISDTYSLIDKIYDDFEQRILELEVPRTCEGCNYYDEETSYMCASHCTSCKRYYYDYYEPKEPK